jgi:ATP-binding cassette subfamily F protein uup
MTYINAKNLTKIVAQKVLFTDISFTIESGSKTALVARNGTGKSTLLKVLAGLVELDGGEINIHKGVKIAYLAQETDLNPENTKYEEILSSDSPIIQAVKRYEESLKNTDNVDELQRAYEDMEKYGAWEYEAKIQEVLQNLGLSQLEGKIKSYSGGEKKRLSLAKIVLEDADLLILDEPTNHIDIETIDWLEEYLSTNACTLLLVTHDRYFLNKVCNQVLELHNGEIFRHKGNYEYYLEKRNFRLSKQNLEIDKTRKHLKKELEWIKRQPHGRQAKSSARVNSFYETKSNLGKKHVEKSIELSSESKRIGTKVLKFHNVSKSFGDKKILESFSYDFRKSERLGIIGNNGVGKSTFLKLILGGIEPDSGKIIIGDTVEFGYYSQYQSELNDKHTVIESIEDIASYIKLPDGSKISASNMLKRFLFSLEEQRTEISKLSGGEKKRVALLRILMKNPNFLILDEPTNDFDLMTLEVLESFLKNFDGCLIIISHDRYFIDNLVDHIFVFKGDGEIKDYPGNYTNYIESIKDAHSPGSDKAKSISTEIKKERRKEAKKLYREIEKLEEQRKEIIEKALQDTMDFKEAKKMSNDISDLDQQIEQMSEEWIILSESN